MIAYVTIIQSIKNTSLFLFQLYDPHLAISANNNTSLKSMVYSLQCHLQ